MDERFNLIKRLKMRLFLALILFMLLSGCATDTQPTARFNSQSSAVRVFKVAKIWETSGILEGLEKHPRTLSEQIASAGREISQSNVALSTSFGVRFAAKIKEAGCAMRFSFRPDLPIKSQANQYEFKTFKPDLILAVVPSKISLNIPGSFFGIFTVTLYDAASSEQLWQGEIEISRAASGKAHQEAGIALAELLAIRLKELGFI